ncbi:MAG: FAD-binding protein [Gammaproteobacteria bacterium]|nr:MAG: FAD-binding protein [Gammaproteobacteria bacterium]
MTGRRQLARRLGELFPPERLHLDAADCIPYGYDNARVQALPDAVVLAETEEEILALVQLCRELRTPLIARGRGTGTTGATVPTQGGIVLSLERMNRILEVNPDDRLMVVEPGVTNAAVQQAAAKHGFFWAPDPTSSATCTVGGNLAYNSAGPRAVKYGTTRDHVLGLRAVTGRGELIRTGTRTTKGVVGYDLTRLLIGSEGTLAIITRATLRLLPQPPCKRTLRALYRDMGSAARAVADIMAQPVTPCALEFIDSAALDLVRDDIELPPEARALLMIEVDGSEAAIDSDTRAVADAARNAGCIELRSAASAQEAADLWAVRKALSPKQRQIAPRKINEDVVVPVSRLPELIEGIEALGRKHGIHIVNFGHAGNGNIHVNLLIDPDDPDQARRAEACLDAIFDLVLELDGTLSGEHGIGLVKKQFVSRELGVSELEHMHAIRQAFDPDGILNPGKALPDA